MDNSSSGSSSGQKHHLALRVALDTMKDRCFLQQKRLTEIEEENQQLRERLTQQKPNNTSGHNGGGVAENFQLRLQVSELQRQNAQLNAHISMVSAENRKLWSSLSQIAKEQTAITLKDNDRTLVASDVDASSEGSPRGGVVAANQNLIRSKTFTQHSPNPNLRHKVITGDGVPAAPTMPDVSLEDNVAVEAYAEDGSRQRMAGNEAMDQVTMGFGFLNVVEAGASSASQDQDFDAEAKMCLDNLQDMHRLALKQQKDLNSVFALLESRLALQPCPECVKKSQKPEMADKSLETDESFNDSKYNTNQHSNIISHLNDTSKSASETFAPHTQTNHLNIIHEKMLADESNKVCPMCGKIYDCGITFESFCEHVEEHFRDDGIEFDQSIEHNFEYISHAVGDF